ncbi:hypothetical protein BgiBS90_017129 [Biomphalaria glabrata]|nr:hypothetical protein BgiBS90_017129 [Biomphalaria glabrata]
MLSRHIFMTYHPPLTPTVTGRPPHSRAHRPFLTKGPLKALTFSSKPVNERLIKDSFRINIKRDHLYGRHCLEWTGLHVSTPLRSGTAWCGQDFTCLHHYEAALLGVDRTSRVYTLTKRHCLVWTRLHVSTPLRSSTARSGQDFKCLHPYEAALLGVNKTSCVYTLTKQHCLV